jgi:tetratricopeptide (TPR) repeat protein
MLGFYSLRTYEWADAEQELQRAMRLGPEFAHRRYANLLMFMGRLKEARAEAELARRLDPTSVVTNSWVAIISYAERDYHRAIEESKKTLEMHPYPSYAGTFLGLSYAAQGKYAEAIVELEKLKGAPANVYLAELGWAYAVAGRRADALRMLAELEERSKHEYVSATDRAEIYWGLGDNDQAFAWLDKAYTERDWKLPYIKPFPIADVLRSDPRFARLLRQMHLE